jgi:hemolysin D
VLTADLFQLADQLDDLDKQMAQKDATLERLKMSIAFEETLLQTLTDRVNTRQKAIDLAVGTKINLYDAKESLQKSQASLASDRGQLIETDAALKELAAQKIKTVSQFVAESENKLVDAARKADEAREGLAKANAHLAHTRLVSPIDGIVQQMSVTTIGQVVTTGQELAVVVPSGGALQVEALVANMDIGFVKLGQEVAIKVDAFPFTRFGVLHGKVTRIAAEAIDEQTAKRTLSDATAASYATMPASATAPGQAPTFVFPVTISLDSPEIKINGVDAPLTPGMTVTAEIKTDSRRVIDYLFSPLAKMGSEALRER